MERLITLQSTKDVKINFSCVWGGGNGVLSMLEFSAMGVIPTPEQITHKQINKISFIKTHFFDISRGGGLTSKKFLFAQAAVFFCHKSYLPLGKIL